MQTLRQEIQEFAEAMETVMASKDAIKGDSWKEVSVINLLKKLRAELLCELEDAKTDEDARRELVDIANYAMMCYFKFKKV